MATLPEPESRHPECSSRIGDWLLVKDRQVIVYHPEEDEFSTEDQAIFEKRETKFCTRQTNAKVIR